MIKTFEYASELIDIPLEEEMRKSYLDYAMSVIVGRALPDARDGLKPVHRRVLHSMNELNNDWNKAYKKSARVVGDTIGKYHPHGDTAVYDTIVRMAQQFSLRYPLVDGQGNFGSVDGDNAAAMRYTEIRLAKIAHQLLADIDKSTVDFGPNYDGSEREPLVMPTRVPNLLLNGSEGIAVGMATKIAPHHLGELLDACALLVRAPDTSVDDLIRIVPAPDFPTGGLICGLSGSAEAYRTGKGSVIIRAKAHFEDIEGGRQAIVIDELPYQVNKKVLQERIAELVSEKKIEGISNIQDESDKSGIRLVIELRRGEMAEVLLNQLYKKTDLQVSFGINMVALVDGRPLLLNLKECLQIFINHRREVIVRKTMHELRAAKILGHELEGYAVAVSNMNEIVDLIKSASDPAMAKEQLLAKRWAAHLVGKMLNPGSRGCLPDGAEDNWGYSAEGYQLSPEQAQKILSLRLQRLTGMEQEKIVGEYKGVLAIILDLEDILAKESRVIQIMLDDFDLMRSEFSDARRSEIIFDAYDIADEDLIPRRDMIVTLTNVGYVKRQAAGDYAAQRRGGRGKSAADIKNEDVAVKIFAANSHDTLLCLTNTGRALPIKVYALPEGSRGGRGRPLVNYLGLAKTEKIADIVAVKEFSETSFLLLCSRDGVIKKTPLAEFKSIRTNGLWAIDISEGDALSFAQICSESDDVLLFSSANRAIRFPIAALRTLSRSAKGVRAMKLGAGERIVSMLGAAEESSYLLLVTEKGYAKRTLASDFRRTSRLASGVRPFPISDQIGSLIKAVYLSENDDVFAMANSGVLIRARAEEIRASSRSAKGSRLIRLDEGDKLIDLIAFNAQEELLDSVEDEASNAHEISGDEDVDG